jgi:hypothetical protein
MAKSTFPMGGRANSGDGKSSARTARREAGDRTAELSNSAPDHGDPGAENGIGQDIQAHLRHARPDTTAYEYMQELPESVQEMVGSMFEKIRKGGDSKKGIVSLLQMLENLPKRRP